MKRLLWLIMPVALVLLPCAVRSQMMSASMYGAGPHGYDWAIGTWSCTNSMPSPMGGPSNTTLKVTRTNGGAMFYRSTGRKFRQLLVQCVYAELVSICGEIPGAA